jgi:nanoRNase/pAp phosphatase (c-di-AMP/oligoRNAs hydrolase)
VAWRIRADGRLSLSFRSVGDMDVSLIAKAYGGGGHKNAAGVELRHTLALTLLSDLIYGVEQK